MEARSWSGEGREGKGKGREGKEREVDDLSIHDLGAKSQPLQESSRAKIRVMVGLKENDERFAAIRSLRGQT